MIDAHCHLADEKIAPLLPRLMESAAFAGITTLIQGGIDPKDWDRQDLLSHQYPGQIIKVFGLHPWSVHKITQEYAEGCATEDELERCLLLLRDRLPRAAALGETGLDFLKDRSSSKREQIWAFQEQIDLAIRLEKPLVLHVCGAHDSALALLDRRAQPGYKFRGIVHSFQGSLETARRYRDLGFLLSLQLRDIGENLDRLQELGPRALVYETDAPSRPAKLAKGTLPTTSHDDPLQQISRPDQLAQVYELAAQKFSMPVFELIKIVREEMGAMFPVPSRSGS